MSENTVIGTTKWFNNDKGYGFITYNEKDFFVYYSDIIGEGYKTLDEGQKVKFVPSQGARGGIAKDVEALSMTSGNR